MNILSKMLDLTYFIKSKLDFPEYGGNKLFSNSIEKKRDTYDRLRIWKDMWAWDFLYSYVFEYYFGEISVKNHEIGMSIFQISDTGYFDKDTNDSQTELATFASEEESISKLIFVAEKKNKKNDYAWEGDWVNKEIVNNKERMSANHKKDCLNHKGNIQIIYSFPLDRFLDEDSTIETLKEFIEYCNSNGISELKLV